MRQIKAGGEVIKTSRRDEIIDAGIRCFTKIPFSDLTMSAIAREAKCGHSLIYHYFDNINDIFDAAIIRILPVFEPQIKYANNPNDAPGIKFVGIISNFIRQLKSDKMFAYYTQTIMLVPTISRNHEHTTKLYERWNCKMIALIKAGQTRKKIVNLEPDKIMTSLLYSIKGLVSSVILEDSGQQKLPAASAIYLPFLEGVQL